MDRHSLAQFTHNAKNFLTIENSNYKQWVFRYTFLELEKDLGVKGDITTKSIFEEKLQVTSRVVAGEDGVIAGLEEIKYFLLDADSSFRSRLNGRFEINFNFKDAENVKKGDIILEIKAELHDLLAVERVLLNLLGRMSGVATFSKEIVGLVKDFDVLIAPTRKTLWGLLDKKAVSLGGGGTHRLNLSDAVLVKDNHLDLLSRNFDLLAEKLDNSRTNCRFIEVEVDTKEECLKCCKALSGKKLPALAIIMLDNFQDDEICKTIAEVKNEGFHDEFLFEASGGINEKNVFSYAKTGVDIISMGALTDGVKRLDLRMEIV